MKINNWVNIPFAKTDDLKKHDIFVYKCPVCEWSLELVDSNPEKYNMNYCPCCGKQLIFEPEEKNNE